MAEIENREELNPGLALTMYEAGAGRVELRMDAARNTVWATQADMAAIFGVDRSVISKHAASVFASGELDEKSNVQKMHIANSDKPVTTYSLDVVISVGYRVNSVTATRFRQWATTTLRQYVSEGYVLNPARLANDPEAVETLLAAIRRTRLSEVAAYAKVRAVFKLSASDYDAESKAAKKFFSLAQDKFHYAVTGKTAAQIVLERADAKKPNMGLTFMHRDHPTQADIGIGKNYLTDEELHYLENICEQWMLFCESKAMRKQRMTMEELLTRLNDLLRANDYPVLYEYDAFIRGKATNHALRQFKRYKQLNAPKPKKALKPG